MKLFRWDIIAVITAAALALSAAVWAQSIAQTDLSGQECWNAGQGPGGPSSGFLCVNVVRGSQPAVASSPTGTLTMGSGTLANLANGGTLLVGLQPATTLTVVAPASPADGAIISLCNITGSNFATTTIAMVANTSQTFNTAASTTTLGSFTCFEYQYARSTTTWYRIR